MTTLEQNNDAKLEAAKTAFDTAAKELLRIVNETPLTAEQAEELSRRST